MGFYVLFDSYLFSIIRLPNPQNNGRMPSQHSIEKKIEIHLFSSLTYKQEKFLIWRQLFAPFMS
jgi:hypothetical protein